MAVSPFDGANRIRFKGSPDCGFAIADWGLEKQSAFSIPKSTFRRDSQPLSRGSPENFVGTVYYISRE